MPANMKKAGINYQGGGEKNPYIDHILRGGTPPVKSDLNWENAVQEVYDMKSGRMKDHYLAKSDSIRNTIKSPISRSPGWPKPKKSGGAVGPNGVL